MADAYNRASPGSGPRHGRPDELGPVIIEARRSTLGRRSGGGPDFGAEATHLSAESPKSTRPLRIVVRH